MSEKKSGRQSDRNPDRQKPDLPVPLIDIEKAMSSSLNLMKPALSGSKIRKIFSVMMSGLLLKLSIVG